MKKKWENCFCRHILTLPPSPSLVVSAWEKVSFPKSRFSGKLGKLITPHHRGLALPLQPWRKAQRVTAGEIRKQTTAMLVSAHLFQRGIGNTAKLHLQTTQSKQEARGLHFSICSWDSKRGSRKVTESWDLGHRATPPGTPRRSTDCSS